MRLLVYFLVILYFGYKLGKSCFFFSFNSWHVGHTSWMDPYFLKTIKCMIVCCNSQIIIDHSEIDGVKKLMFIGKNCIIHLNAPAPILLKTHFTKQFGRNPPNLN